MSRQLNTLLILYHFQDSGFEDTMDSLTLEKGFRDLNKLRMQFFPKKSIKELSNYSKLYYKVFPIKWSRLHFLFPDIETLPLKMLT